MRPESWGTTHVSNWAARKWSADVEDVQGTALATSMQRLGWNAVRCANNGGQVICQLHVHADAPGMCCQRALRFLRSTQPALQHV